MAVRYVVLTDAPPDYSSQAESRLLRNGRSGLAVVLRSSELIIYAVPSPRSIISGPHHPRVLALGSSSVVIKVKRAGTYRLALRYTPYWSAPGACINETANGLLNLRTMRGGVIRLSFAFSASSALAAFTGARSSCDLPHAPRQSLATPKSPWLRT
jgi:hypothetical protein